jgi:hypothetical protein
MVSDKTYLDKIIDVNPNQIKLVVKEKNL